MSEWKKIVDNLKKIDYNSFFEDEYKKKTIQSFVIRSIRKRLYFEGKDKNDSILRTNAGKSSSNGHYADSTITIKKTNRQGRDRRTKNVTLHDTKYFYASMAMQPKKTHASMIADFQKNGGHIFKNFTSSYGSIKEFESSILGLNNEENNVLANMLAPDISRKIVLKVFNV